jgi:ribonuclease inhibitor
MHGTIGEPTISSATQFHRQIADAFKFPPYYGKNLDALWDVLRIDIERPSTLVWLNSARSRTLMKEDFNDIVELIRDVAEHDREHGLSEFELILR